MRHLIILLLVLAACKNGKRQNFELKPLRRNVQEFKSGKNRNRIDYFYVKGNFTYEKLNYALLEKKVKTELNSAVVQDYDLYSLYIYRDADLSQKKYDGAVNTFDGQNEKLVAYIRYKQGKMDIFYIIKNGKVVFDLISGNEEYFEFDE